ncbi:MAG: M23 family metallopeptidase [Myxococcales bacterium]|nr:M23 family metallopeptidase [Myxococcales bacterium]
MRRLLLAVAVLIAAVVALAAILASPTARALSRFARPPDAAVVPVLGVAPRSLSGSFGEPRSEHRRHKGIDIFARRGTPVVATVAGQVIRVGQNRLGGNVVWIAGEGAQIYYYAHLDRFRDGLHRGDDVARGDLLGYVGTTGNAARTPPHLHFAIHPAWTGFAAIDPAPWLKGHCASR